MSLEDLKQELLFVEQKQIENEKIIQQLKEVIEKSKIQMKETKDRFEKTKKEFEKVKTDYEKAKENFQDLKGKYQKDNFRLNLLEKRFNEMNYFWSRERVNRIITSTRLL